MNYIVVVSDSHGRREKLHRLLPVIEKADFFVFLGDCTGDIYALKKDISVPVIAVNGNCDCFKAYEDEEIVDWRGHRILCTHGHRYGVKRDLLNVTYAAKEKNCDCDRRKPRNRQSNLCGTVKEKCQYRDLLRGKSRGGRGNRSYVS